MNLHTIKRSVVTAAVSLAVLEGLQLVGLTLVLWRVW